MANGPIEKKTSPNRFVLVWVFGCIACCIGCEPPGEEKSLAEVESVEEQLNPGDFASGHERMLAELKRAARMTGQTDPFLGDKKAITLRDQLAALPPGESGPEKVNLHFHLANQELRLGNEKEAIRLLEWVFDQIPTLDPPMPEKSKNQFRFNLGVAYLRFAETQNCCARNTPESCILPIRGQGLHTLDEGSLNAIKYFGRVLENSEADESIHQRAKWLLNISYMTLGKYPDEIPSDQLIPPSVFATKVEFPEFENIAPILNIKTQDICGGVIIDDFDNDGNLDIVSSTNDLKGRMHFFRNQSDGTFLDRTDRAGLNGFTGGLNMVQADFNNDGNVDIFVLRGAWLGKNGKHPNSLLRNQGDGTFRDVTFEAGLGEFSLPTQTAAWADYDNDGDLDLFVGNEHSLKDRMVAPCQLFRNNGDETFTDVAKTAGVENLRFTKGAVWGDYNNDRYPDLYLSNMNQKNRLYLNKKDGTFEDVAVELKVARPVDSFPVWFWDVDNDGVLDLYVSSYLGSTGSLAEVAASYMGEPFKIESPRLFRGDGNGGFTDESKAYGLTALFMPMGANFGDLNGDGFLDFYLGTGYPNYESLMPNVMFLNQQGQSFVDVTTAGRFGHLQKGHGIAFADLDNDGDQDVFAQMGGAYPGDKFSNALYENPGFDHRWLSIQLVGHQTNRSAIGARIKVTINEGERSRSVYKHVNSGGSFGASPLRQTLGLGKANSIEQLEIYWPTSDKTQVFEDVAMDQFIRIHEDKDQFETVSIESFEMPASAND